MSKSKIYHDWQQLFVKPLARVEFCCKFIVINSLANLVIIFLCSQVNLVIYNQNNLTFYVLSRLLTSIIIGFLIGFGSGTLQYLTLSNYFTKSWRWAIALVGIFYGVRTSSGFYSSLIGISFFTPNNPDLFEIIVLGLLLNLLVIFLLLAQGFVQRAILKSAIAGIGWWLFLPLIVASISGFQYLPFALILWLAWSKYITVGKRIIYYLLAIKIAATVIYFPVIIGWLPSHNLLFVGYRLTIYSIYNWLSTAGLSHNDFKLYLFNGISYVLMFSAIQALIICCLQRKDSAVINNLSSTSWFASSLDVSNYFQVRSIVNNLSLRLNRLWQGNNNYDYPVDLNYWVTVGSDSSIVAVDPVNPVSQDNFANTPLASLVENLEMNQANISSESDANFNPTAKLEVKFIPPGILTVKSLSGIPLLWLAISNFILIMVISYGSVLIASKFI